MYWVSTAALKSRGYKHNGHSSNGDEAVGEKERQSIVPVEPELIPETVVYEPQFRMESDSTDIHTYLSALFRHRWLMLLIALTVFAAGMAYTLTRRPVYESTAKVVVVTDRGTGSTSSNEQIPILQDVQALRGSRSVQTQAEVMASPDILGKAYQDLDQEILRHGFGSKSLPGWAYKIIPGGETDVIAIVCRGYTPAAAAGLANSIAETYFKYDLEQTSLATRQAREYAERELISVGNDLAEANSALSGLKRTTGLFAPDAQLPKAADQLSQLSLDLHAAKTEAASIQREVEALQKELAAEKSEVVLNSTITLNPQFNTIREKIDELNSKRTELLQEFTPESREVKALDEQILQEEQRLKRVAETVVGSKVEARNPIRDTLLTRYATSVATLAATNARVKAIEHELSARKSSTRSLPERERELQEQAQRVSLLQRRYDMLSGNYYNLVLREQATIPNGTMVSKAYMPSEPSYPNTKSNAAFFLALGIILAVVAAVVSERFDTRLHDEGVVEKISGLQTLSLVPEMSRDIPRLIGSNVESGPLLESFRILRNNLCFMQKERQCKILAVTSPGRGEGKSTTVVNLAVAIAMEGKKVLLVDGDVRRPSLHKYLVVPRSVGLTTLLNGTSTMEESIAATSIKNVYCLSSGPACSNPAEMMNSQDSRRLFDELARQFDVVIIDCPPATGLSDVQIISGIADGMLLVVSMNHTLKPQLNLTLKTLAQAGAPLIGLVVNRMDVRRPEYGYYYYTEDIDEANDVDLPDSKVPEK